MTAPRDVALDPGVYMEVLEEDLLNETRRARIYRTQARQLTAQLDQYRERFGELDGHGDLVGGAPEHAMPSPGPRTVGMPGQEDLDD